ncbi:MAG TPA: hypothetical protein VJS42_21280 [Steroidobacteraceae bacterium]|nr:hypothetical protein [Steroidobacteraceae bacterium]
MRQQINLYQPIFRARRRLFSAATVGIAAGLLILTYAGIWSFGSFKVARLDEAVRGLQAQAEAQDSMIAAAAGYRAQRAKPAELEARIARLSTELTQRTRALEVLRSGVAGEPSGFATRLEALARGHLQGVWLDHLVLTGPAGTQGNLRLEGAAVNADLIPRYLQSLAAEADLMGVRFAQFAIERPKRADEASATSSIRFRASSAALLDTATETAP